MWKSNEQKDKSKTNSATKNVSDSTLKRGEREREFFWLVTRGGDDKQKAINLSLVSCVLNTTLAPCNLCCLWSYCAVPTITTLSLLLIPRSAAPPALLDPSALPSSPPTLSRRRCCCCCVSARSITLFLWEIIIIIITYDFVITIR